MKAITYFTLLACGSLLTLSPIAQAADEKKPEAAARKKGDKGDRKGAMQDRFGKVSEELKLTDEQKEKLKPVFKEESEKMMAIRKDAGSDRKGAMQKIRDLSQEVNGKVKPVLTPEQLEKWEKIKDDNMPARKKK
jgi:Spy/CpxP family protein refolding chaperone